ncbi:MAG: cation:proton antiporter, partial [Tidjanibacter sp.]|nr:cation:proton antiporter [Tidjanibacter sp.]
MTLTSENILLIGAILLFVGILASKISNRFGTPMLLLFLAVGMLFGTDGLGIEFNSPRTAQFIGTISLCIILFSGGMDTKFTEIRPVLGQGITLATLGVVLTTLLTGGFIYFIAQLFNLELTFMEALLPAAVVSSTDSASVFSILRTKRQGLKENLRPLLELESGSND